MVIGDGRVRATLEMRRTTMWKVWPLLMVVGRVTVKRPAKLIVPRSTDGIGM
jgi:hypothetical protein